MNLYELANLQYSTGYTFENGERYYERLGEERAQAILNALEAKGYRIVHERDISIVPQDFHPVI
jgi:hypothetical protein